ncbi:hypothetical protein CRG98_022722 [Punica granatum]|uniref:Uncharacterized protein n=1 Tax=Punica granatum TaxID=22663 RepID=A0A2I0JLU8_PUNGR|nr:hypothetical protein CRG98_022722 [Punica granatum]
MIAGLKDSYDSYEETTTDPSAAGGSGRPIAQARESSDDEEMLQVRKTRKKCWDPNNYNVQTATERIAPASRVSSSPPQLVLRNKWISEHPHSERTVSEMTMERNEKPDTQKKRRGGLEEREGRHK